MARPVLAFAAAALFGFAVLAPAAAPAQSLTERLEGDRLGAIEPGTYDAGDNLRFAITRYGQDYLLRFAGRPEVFVLYADNASLGGRVLKYDSGKTALQITGWGGITLYTDAKPDGLPATRAGEASAPTLPDISLDALKLAMAADTQSLAASRHMTLAFTADWDRLAGDAQLRAQFLDALDNTVRGLERFAAQPGGQKALAGKVQTVFVTGSGKPTLQRKGTRLIVAFDPAKGYAGRASSRAIARALRTLFQLR